MNYTDDLSDTSSTAYADALAAILAAFQDQIDAAAASSGFVLDGITVTFAPASARRRRDTSISFPTKVHVDVYSHPKNDHPLAKRFNRKLKKIVQNP